MDYANMMREIRHILQDNEATEHKMSIHYIEGQILAVIHKYDKAANPKVM